MCHLSRLCCLEHWVHVYVSKHCKKNASFTRQDTRTAWELRKVAGNVWCGDFLASKVSLDLKSLIEYYYMFYRNNNCKYMINTFFRRKESSFSGWSMQGHCHHNPFGVCRFSVLITLFPHTKLLFSLRCNTGCGCDPGSLPEEEVQDSGPRNWQRWEELHLRSLLQRGAWRQCGGGY